LIPPGGISDRSQKSKRTGLLTPKGLAELRRGNCATITLGPYAGQEATADHIIPRSICPELDSQIFNLELLPAQMNSAKGNKITDRARVFAKELYDAGLLSEEGCSGRQKIKRR